MLVPGRTWKVTCAVAVDGGLGPVGAGVARRASTDAAARSALFGSLTCAVTATVAKLTVLGPPAVTVMVLVWYPVA